jgi:butyrate kinase
MTNEESSGKNRVSEKDEKKGREAAHTVSPADTDIHADTPAHMDRPADTPAYTDRPADSPSDRLSTVTDLVEIAGKMKASSVAIAGGYRPEDLRLVESARDHGIIDRIILVGSESMVSSAVEEVGIGIAEGDIVNAENDEAIASATVKLILSGSIDIVLKGGISTPVINRHMIRLASRPTVSLATVFEAAPVSGGKPMIITDAGVTTVCSFGRLVNLIDNAVEVAKVVMNIPLPRVAVLSANEKQIPSLPSTWTGKKLAERRWDDALVCGPLSFDLATDPESVEVKGLPNLPNAGEVAGRADILVCPGIDAANILYKTLTAMTKYGQASLAGITVGFPVPYIILSRADTIETRLLSIALCSIYAQRITAERKKLRAGEKPKPAARHRVLVINPGSTSVKIALYENDEPVKEKEVQYGPGTGLPEAAGNKEKVEWLAGLVDMTFSEWGGGRLDAVTARGGFVPSPGGSRLEGGTYLISGLRGNRSEADRALVEAMTGRPEKEHASNLGIPAAALLAEKYKVPAFCVDPVVVDEFCPEAVISGYRPIQRRSVSHALSVRAAARKAAEFTGKQVEDINVVVAHLGGGITVASVKKGKMTDNNIALLGEGPFSPRRTGTLPADGLIDLCYSGKFTIRELKEELTNRGGLQSYLGDWRMEEIERRVSEGDRLAGEVVDAMVYRIAKEIGAMYVAAGCDVEAIVFTGGLVKSSLIRDSLRRRVVRLAPVLVFEGSLEMQALASGAVRVLSGKEKPKRFRI